MEDKVRPSPRLEPLPAEHTPELRENFELSGLATSAYPPVG